MSVSMETSCSNKKNTSNCIYSSPALHPSALSMDAVEMKAEADVKRLKRRRRSPSLLALDQPQLDQTTAATTTKRSSRFRGVSRHRWTGRFEAHLWDKGSWNETQKKKGKQVYLGAYDEEEAAARAYDLAAIKYWGSSTYTNFPISDYESEIEMMVNVTREEYLASLRRRSSGFARGVSKYRGVARHHHNGRWEARIGRVFGNKYLYLGTYGTQEEAAHAYDIAAIEYRGINAVTNFDLSTYIRWLRPNAPPNPIDINLNKEPSSGCFSAAVSQKHEIIERKMPLNPWNKAASPSALGLLLRSSLFKQLLDKTSSSAVADGDEEDNDGPVIDDDKEARFATEENNTSDSASPAYDQSGKSFWNAYGTHCA